MLKRVEKWPIFRRIVAIPRPMSINVETIGDALVIRH
jgi:hypothetical protein